MEAALRARADDYNRVRAEVIELRQRCDELEDRALLAEEEARSARRQCDQLRQENTRLSTRLSRIEGELH